MKIKNAPHQKIIVLEWSKPRNAHERGCYGMTTVNGAKDIATIFLNSKYRAKAGGWLLVEAFFHEVGHAFLEFHTDKLNGRQAETIARKLGKAALQILRPSNGGNGK